MSRTHRENPDRIRRAVRGRPPASAAAGSSQLNPGETLTSGQQLVSPSGGYVAVMQSDGNFVEYGPGGAVVWATSTKRAPRVGQ
jgi:hypothetical protein